MLGLISGFIAQPGACKMVTFYCFLAFSFLFLSLFSLSLLFQISTSGHKNARAAPVPLGTHSSHRDPWCPHPSFLSSSYGTCIQPLHDLTCPANLTTFLRNLPWGGKKKHWNSLHSKLEIALLMPKIILGHWHWHWDSRSLLKQFIFSQFWSLKV